MLKNPSEHCPPRKSGHFQSRFYGHFLPLLTVLPDVNPHEQAKTFNVYVIYDPAYTSPPRVLATPLKLKAATVKAIYQDRWPVEQIPLSAKQMVGAHLGVFAAF